MPERSSSAVGRFGLQHGKGTVLSAPARRGLDGRRPVSAKNKGEIRPFSSGRSPKNTEFRSLN